MSVGGTTSARLILVIETKAVRGEGTKEDPVREVTQYWDLDGKRLAESDPAINEKEVQRLIQSMMPYRDCEGFTEELKQRLAELRDELTDTATEIDSELRALEK